MLAPVWAAIEWLERKIGAEWTLAAVAVAMVAGVAGMASC